MVTVPDNDEVEAEKVGVLDYCRNGSGIVIINVMKLMI